MKKWIRISGPGEFRGQGTWHEVRGEKMEADFEQCKATSFLPVIWEVSEAEIVKDPTGKEPHFIMRNGMLIHQFHRVAIALAAVADQRSVQHAHAQLKHFLDTVLVIDGTSERVPE